MALCISCDESVNAEVAAIVARREREDVERRMRESGLPKAYASGSRSTAAIPETAADVLTACQMLGNGLRGLYLHGPAGSYKTTAGAAWLASRIRLGASGRYVFVPDLMTDLHAIYAGGGGSRAEIVHRLISTPLLVLDDLGKEKASEHAAGVLFEILDGRYRDQRNDSWLIVTSNYTLDDLCDRFPPETGEPIRRRLSESTVSVAMP